MGEQSQLQYVTDLLLSCFRHLTLFGLSLVLIIAIVIRLLGNSHITLTHVSLELQSTNLRRRIIAGLILLRQSQICNTTTLSTRTCLAIPRDRFSVAGAFFLLSVRLRLPEAFRRQYEQNQS